MKSLIIYDSNFDNTKLIAEAIAIAFGTSATPVNNLNTNSINNIELLIVGSPINAWSPSTNMKTWINSLQKNQLSGKKAAEFDTRMNIWLSGNAAKKLLNNNYEAIR